MDNDLNATFEACNNFNKKLKDTIKVEANMKILKKISARHVWNVLLDKAALILKPIYLGSPTRQL